MSRGKVLSEGGVVPDLTDSETESLFVQALEQACVEAGPVSSVLIIPPDITRFHSRAGFLTGIAYRELIDRKIAVTILPALGTHTPLTSAECGRMFPGVPESLFRAHDWRNDVVELGRIEREWIEQVTEGAVSYDWPVQVNKLLCSGGFDLIISVGQVVPHEVTGMANHAKNLLVGTGGKETIDKSHFAGAAYGMEKIMGRTNTPVRAMLDEGLRRYGNKLPPALYALTVLSARSKTESLAVGKPEGSSALRGLFCGFGRACFEQAAALARQVNVDLLEEPISKAVVYLDPKEFRTAWLGNKAIYRTRMAMADGGELLIIAPGLERFGEDLNFDALIRKYGYRPARFVQEKVNGNKDLADNLGVAAHLIHGSGEGRFTVRYCPGPGMSRQEIESAGFEWGNIDEAMARYDVAKLAMGWNDGNVAINNGGANNNGGAISNGERFFFIPNPALGLWALRNTEQ
jgi:nickel-dependent lactate racemase